MNSRIGQVHTPLPQTLTQPQDKPAPQSSPGTLQGRSVQVQPHARRLTEPLPTRSEPPPSSKPSLEQRQVRQSTPPPTLLRQARHGALPSVNQLIGRAGRPKDDISFGIFGTKKMSTGYKEILSGLEQYHASCEITGQQRSVGSPRVQRQMVNEMMTRLDKLAQAAERYGSGGGHSRTEAIKDLRAQIANERMVLQGLIDELDKGGSLPEGASLSDALAFAREGVSLKDMARLMEKGLQPDQAKEARELLDSERGRSLLDDPQRMAPYRTGGFSDGEAFLLELSGLGREGGDEYVRLGIPITHQTIVTERTDEHRLGGMSRLGSGAFNEVYGARYEGPEGVVKGVFKPLKNEEHGWVSSKIGIDKNHPQIANRNLATVDVARALGFDVVVDCQIGSRRPPPPPDDQPLQIGLVMGHAPGVTAHQGSFQLFMQPEVQREITKLQLLDHLVGQGDRHGGNYFIDVSPEGRVKVSGIDNDQCFGKNTLHGDDIRWGPEKERDGFRGTRMPPVMDTEMVAAIRSMSPERLRGLLGDKLSPEEVHAAESRLQSLLDHIDKLESQGRVIAPQDWGREPHAGLFNSENSYFARDLSRVEILF